MIKYSIIAFLSVVALLVVLSKLGVSSEALAAFGSFTALVSVVATALVSAERIKLDREKIELESMANITKDTYKDLLKLRLLPLLMSITVISLLILMDLLMVLQATI